jgi:hypothetical protein
MNLIKYIFTTNIYDDTHKMPNKNKMILSISSLWILNLLSHCYYNNLKILLFLLSILSIISPVFWYNYKVNSLYHKIDKSIVISLFIYLMQTNYYLYYHFYYLISITSIIAIFYILSIKTCIYNNYELQLYSHLSFRYFTFLLLFHYIINYNDNGNNNNKNNNYMKLITIEYIIFNNYLIFKIKNKKIIKYLFYNILIVILNECIYYLNDKKLILPLYPPL